MTQGDMLGWLTWNTSEGEFAIERKPFRGKPHIWSITTGCLTCYGATFRQAFDNFREALRGDSGDLSVRSAR